LLFKFISAVSISLGKEACLRDTGSTGKRCPSREYFFFLELGLSEVLSLQPAALAHLLGYTSQLHSLSVALKETV